MHLCRFILKGNFTVYRSSAGSGKTHTLVKEYLRLVLTSDQPFRFSRILAITFTNKAAEEMKERIIDNLFKLRSSAGDAHFSQAYLDEMCDFCQLGPEEVQQSAARTLELILHNYHLFQISTIDKFVYRIIKTFSRDLNLDAEFDISTDNEQILSLAIEELMQKVGENEELTLLLREFALSKADEGASWEIEKELTSFSQTIFSEDSRRPLSLLNKLSIHDFLSIRKKMDDEISTFEAYICERLEKIQELFRKNGITEEDLHGKSRGLFSFLKKLAACDYTALKGNDYVFQFISGEKTFHKDVLSDKQSVIQSAHPQVSALLSEMLQYARDKFQDYFLLKTLRKNIYALSLLNEIYRIQQVIKDENNFILVSDFNNLIAEVVSNEPAPFIYERTGEKYLNFFIDEFQDTSELQWKNILPLVDNSLSAGNFNLIVGDAKQSIYRWRNGNVEQFVQLPHLAARDNIILAEREVNLIHSFEEKNLDTNYRSQKEVIEFNNRLFDLMKEYLSSEYSPLYKKAYEGVRQNTTPGKPGGYVELELFDKDDTIPAGFETFRDYFTAQTWKKIQTCTEEGFNYSDIAVITRTNHEGDIISRFLVEKNIPVIAGSTLLLNNSPEIRMIISYMKAVYVTRSAADKLSFMCSWLLSGSGETDITKVILQYRFIKNKEVDFNIDKFLRDRGIDTAAQFFHGLTLYEKVVHAASVLKISLNTVYGQQFAETVFNYANTHSQNLFSFITWWDEHKDKLTVSTSVSNNAVTVITIHKSKGLQYPVVIVPFAEWVTTKGKSNEWIELNEDRSGLGAALITTSKTSLNGTEYQSIAEQEQLRTLFDHINMLYVAFTRAEERLYAFSNLRKGGIEGMGKFLIPAAKNVLQKGEGIWFAGEKTKKQQKQKASEVVQIKETHHAITEFISWKQKLRIGYVAPEDFKPGKNDLRHYGNLLHEAISRIFSPEDISKVLNKMQVKGFINFKEREKLKADLELILHDPKFIAIHDGADHIWSEQEIFIGDGRVTRPDRIIIKNGSAILIDFKTGEISPDHHLQVTQYAGVISACGYPVAETYLYYFKGNEWVKVNNFSGQLSLL